MGFFNFPHTRTYDTDLGWIILRLNEISKQLSEYLENAVITFADPITWDITEQYTALTCVIDSDGTAYLSKQPVPAGVDITNTNYWLPIFNYDDNINQLRAQIALNAQNSPTTPAAIAEGDLVFWNGLLYHALTDMPAGTAFIVGTNIDRYTVDDKINEYNDALNQEIQARTDADAAINERIDGEIQNRTNADTTINGRIDDEIQNRTDADTAIWTAINAIETGVFVKPESKGAIGDGVTDDTAAVQAAINDVINGVADAVLLEKTYLITSTLSIPGDCIILGSSKGTLKYSTAFDVLYATDNKLILYNVTFEGPAPQDANNGYHIVTLFDSYNSFVCYCTFNNVNAEAAIYVNSTTNVIVSHNKIINFSFIGILVYRDCTNTWICDNMINNCVNTSSGYGIQNNVPGAGGAYATDLIIDHNIIKNIPVWDGIMSHGGTNVRICGNICDNCRTGIDCSAKYTDAFSIQKNYVISDNILISSTDDTISGSNLNVGIIFGYDNSSIAVCCTIANNQIRNFNIGTGGNTGGIRLSNCINVKVIGNNILNCKRAMIWASNKGICGDWSISGNMFECTAQGFNIGGGAYKNIIVTGNNFRGIGSNIWAFGVGGAARLVKCFERSNTFDNIYEAPPSSGARLTFHTERDVAANANQQSSVYQAGDIVYSSNPQNTIGWVAMNTGINAPTAWTAETALSVGALVNNNGNAYICTAAGTTGTTAPTHIEGESANGSCVLLYVGASSITWKAFGAIIS